MTVVVALLVQRSIQNPEVRGSNPVIGKLYIERFTVNCIEKTKIQKRGQLFKKTNHNIGLKRKTEQDILKKNFWAGKARTKKIEMMEKVKNSASEIRFWLDLLAKTKIEFWKSDWYILEKK